MTAVGRVGSVRITSNTYYDWVIDHGFMMVPAQAFVGQFLMTFEDYPQRQKAASFKGMKCFRS